MKKLSSQAKEYFKHQEKKVKEKVIKNKKKMPIEYVETIDGKKEDINNCVKLEDKSGYEYGAKYAIKTSKYLIQDIITKEWFTNGHPFKTRVLSNFKIAKDRQIIDYKESWTLSKYLPQFIFPNSNAIYTSSVEILQKEGFIEHKVLGLFYHPSYKIHESFNIEKPRYRKFSNPLKYMFEPNLSDKIKLGIVSPTFNIFEGKRHTFGVELETSEGNIPSHKTEGLNVSCVYDGSLKDEHGIDWGGEYPTGILQGDKGIEQLEKICQALSVNCKVDKRCGIHCHVGIPEPNKQFIVAVYMLATLLEDEIFSMLPASRKTNEYCQVLRSPDKLHLSKYNKDFSAEEYNLWIDDSYEKIFTWISSGHTPGRDTDKFKDHPRGHNAGYDRTSARYCWLNFVPTVFNTKKTLIQYDKNNRPSLQEDNKTLEFRNHGGTISPMKVINWVKICIGIVSFAENHKTAIYNNYIGDRQEVSIPINLASVMEKVYPRTFKRIVKYIDGRKEYFANTGKVAAENKEYKEVYSEKKNLKEIINEV